MSCGALDVVLGGRVDTGKGIRNTFEVVPDAPVTSFTLEMQGGNKGLLENSENLCKVRPRASVRFDGQNGKIADSTPLVSTSCKGGKGKKKGRRHH